MNTTELETKFNTFVAGCQNVVNLYFDQNYPNMPVPTIRVEKGRRYWRLVRAEPHSNSVFCFVDTSNGNVLKSASYKTPATGARGNILDNHNGLARITPYGAAYNR